MHAGDILFGPVEKAGFRQILPKFKCTRMSKTQFGKVVVDPGMQCGVARVSFAHLGALVPSGHIPADRGIEFTHKAFQQIESLQSQLVPK